MNLTNIKQLISKFAFSHSDIAEPAYAPSSRSDEMIAMFPESEPEVKRTETEQKAAPASIKTFAKTTAKPAPKSAATSVIAEDMTVEGSIKSESDLLIVGTVNGDITCTGDIEINGRITGNVKGNNITLNAAEVTGDVTADNMLTLSGGMVNGSVAVRTADIDGVVKGNITALGLLSIKKSAVIQGDITAASISVSQEAVAHGKIMIGKIS